MEKKVKFNVTGMTCAACSAHVHKAVSSLPGVKEAEVSLLTNSMYVTFSSPADERQICLAIEKAGYDAAVSGASQKERKISDEETSKLLKRLIASIVLLIPLFYFSMGYMNPSWGWPLGAIGENPFYLSLIHI